MNHFENMSGAARGLIAIRSVSFLGSHVSRSNPRRGNDPIPGRRNQLLKKSRSYFLGGSSLARDACLRTASSIRCLIKNCPEKECFVNTDYTARVSHSVQEICAIVPSRLRLLPGLATTNLWHGTSFPQGFHPALLTDRIPLRDAKFRPVGRGVFAC